MKSLLSSIEISHEFPVFALRFVFFLLLFLLTAGGWYWYGIYCVVFVILVMSMYYSPLAAVALFMFSEMIGLLLFQHYHSFLGLDFGPIRLHTTDIMCIVLAVALLIRFAKFGLSIPLRNDLSLAFIIFGALVAFGIVRGLGVYAEAAAGEARPYLHFVALVLYFTTHKLSKAQFLRLFKFFCFFLCILMFIGLLRALAIVPMQFNVPGSFKVINASQALFAFFIYFALLVTQLNNDRQSFFMYFSTSVLLFLVVILQHRSVWLSGVIGLGMLLLVFRMRLTRYAFAVIVLAILLSWSVSLFPSNALMSVTKAMKVSALEPFQLHQRNTASWRFAGWVSLLRQLDSARLWIFGRGYGEYFERTVWRGSKVQSRSNPHSFYVATVVGLGIIGISVFIFLVYRLERKVLMIGRETSDKFTSNLMGILAVCIPASLGFMVAYGLHVYIDVLFAIAIPYTIQQEQVLIYYQKEVLINGVK